MLTKTVTKAFPDANHVGLHLKLVDDSREPDDQIIIDHDYMEQWASGTDVPNPIKVVIGKRMQKDINNYIGLKTRYDAPAYDLAATQVEDGLTL